MPHGTMWQFRQTSAHAATCTCTPPWFPPADGRVADLVAGSEYEEQPGAPDIGASVQLESAESLVGPPNEEALDAGYIPPDRPYVLDEDGVTPAAIREGESLDERLHRERPDAGVEEPTPDGDYQPEGLAGDERSGRLAPAVDTAIEGTGGTTRSDPPMRLTSVSAVARPAPRRLRSTSSTSHR